MNVNELTDAAVMVYDQLIPRVQAEEDLRLGRFKTPGELGRAVALVRDDPHAGAVAEANARLALASKDKGF